MCEIGAVFGRAMHRKAMHGFGGNFGRGEYESAGEAEGSEISVHAVPLE
jgi:hypothetical protein